MKRQREAKQRDIITKLNQHFRAHLRPNRIQTSNAVHRAIKGEKVELARAIVRSCPSNTEQSVGTILWRSRWLVWKILCFDKDGLHTASDSADPECTVRFVIVITAEEEAEDL